MIDLTLSTIVGAVALYALVRFVDALLGIEDMARMAAEWWRANLPSMHFEAAA